MKRIAKQPHKFPIWGLDSVEIPMILLNMAFFNLEDIPIRRSFWVSL